MGPRNKIRTATVLAAAALLATVTLVPTIGASAVPWWNERKGLEDETAVLNETADDADYDASYEYTFENDDGDDEDNTDDVNVTDGGVTAASFPADMRVVGVDLTDAANPLTEVPSYDDDETGQVLKIQFPDSSKILFSDSVTQFCLAFAVERGVLEADIADDDELVVDYKVEFGAGDAVLWSGSFAGDEDDGSADSKEKGTCLGESDTADADYGFGKKLEVVAIQGFLNKAYLLEDKDEPAEFYLKVTNLRAEDVSANATELGDLMDFGVQFYTWGGDKTEYVQAGTWYNAFGAIALVLAFVFTAALNPSESELAQHIHRKTRGGA